MKPQNSKEGLLGLQRVAGGQEEKHEVEHMRRIHWVTQGAQKAQKKCSAEGKGLTTRVGAGGRPATRKHRWLPDNANC